MSRDMVPDWDACDNTAECYSAGMTLGQLLRRHRLRLGKRSTQAWVASELGVQKENISRWEHDRTEPKPVHLARLAQVYGTDANEYLDLLMKQARRQR